MSQSFKMATFLFSAYFGGHFCYHSNGKSKINTRLLHLAYCSNKLIYEEIGEPNFYFVVLQRGQNSPLMHVAAFKLEMC